MADRYQQLPTRPTYMSWSKESHEALLYAMASIMKPDRKEYDAILLELEAWGYKCSYDSLRCVHIFCISSLPGLGHCAIWRRATFFFEPPVTLVHPKPRAFQVDFFRFTSSLVVQHNAPLPFLFT